MPSAFETNAEVVWEFAKIVQSIRDRYRGKLKPEEERVFNTVQFWALFFHDFVVVLAEMDREQPDRRRNAFGRVLATVLFEALDDMPHLLANVFRDMRALGSPEAELAPLDTIRLRLRALRATYGEELEVLRLHVSAHRDHDASKQWEVIGLQNSRRLLELGFALTKWCTDMLYALQPMIVRASEVVVARCGPYEEQGK